MICEYESCESEGVILSEFWAYHYCLCASHEQEIKAMFNEPESKPEFLSGTEASYTCCEDYCTFADCPNNDCSNAITADCD